LSICWNPLSVLNNNNNNKKKKKKKKKRKKKEEEEEEEKEKDKEYEKEKEEEKEEEEKGQKEDKEKEKKEKEKEEEEEDKEEKDKEEEENKKKKKKKKKNVMCCKTVKVILISNLGILHRRCTLYAVGPSVCKSLQAHMNKHFILWQTLCHDRFPISATERLRARDGTAVQAGRSRVLFPIVSLGFFFAYILPTALWPFGWLRF